MSSALMAMGYLPVFTSPYQVLALSKELPLSLATGLVTAAMVGVALGSILCPQLSRVISPKSLAILGAGLLLAGNIGGAVITLPAGLFATQLLTGFGGGLGFGLANIIIASSPVPEKGYGVANALSCGFFAVLLAVMPSIIDPSVKPHFFRFQCAVTLLLMLATFMTPDHRTPVPEKTAGTLKVSTPVIFLFAGALFFYTACGGGYALSGKAAAIVGMSSSAYGVFVSTVALMGVVGSTIVGFTGLRWGRMVPLVTGVALTGTCLVLVTANVSPAVLGVGMVGYGLFSFYAINYIMGLGAAIDSSGRTVGVLAGFVLLPYATGPSLFGILAEHFGWRLIVLAIVLLCAATLIVLIKAARSISAAAE